MVISNIIVLFKYFLNLKKISIFCFKYNYLEWCTDCSPPIQKTSFLNPIINFDINYLYIYSIIDLINMLLQSKISVCSKCGYMNDTIINENDKKHYITIVNIECPIFIIIRFELSKI